MGRVSACLSTTLVTNSNILPSAPLRYWRVEAVAHYFSSRQSIIPVQSQSALTWSSRKKCNRTNLRAPSPNPPPVPSSSAASFFPPLSISRFLSAPALWKTMKIPCSVALVLAASSPQGGTGFTTSTAALRNVKGASAGNMRMAGDTAYVCNGLVHERSF